LERYLALALLLLSDCWDTWFRQHSSY